MDKIVITAEKLMEMRDYVPLAEKLRFVGEAADGCFDRMEIKIKNGADSLPIPPLYKENTGIKSRMLMGAFARLYFGAEIDAEKESPWLMSVGEYDRWAGSHVFNQIDRLKKGRAEVRDRAFDILVDYKDLEKRMNAEIFGMLQVMNEPVSRIMTAIGQQTTPEAMTALKQELEGVQKELQDYAVKKNGGGA